MSSKLMKMRKRLVVISTFTASLFASQNALAQNGWQNRDRDRGRSLRNRDSQQSRGEFVKHRHAPRWSGAESSIHHHHYGHSGKKCNKWKKRHKRAWRRHSRRHERRHYDDYRRPARIYREPRHRRHDGLHVIRDVVLLGIAADHFINHH